MKLSVIIEQGFRFSAGVVIFIYGISKPWQFKATSLIDKPVNELSGYELLFAFFGYSQELMIIIGVLQIIGALLLVVNRTKLIGALLLLPIMTNILLFDLFYKIPLGATVIAAILWCTLIAVLFYERQKMIQLIAVLWKEGEQQPQRFVSWLVSVGLCAGIFFVYNFIHHYFNHLGQN